MAKTIYQQNEELIALLKKQKEVPPLRTPGDIWIEEDTEGFNRRRNIFMMISLIVSFFAVATAYTFFLPLFAITFGFFLAFLCIVLVIVFDYYILPGDTIGAISKNAIASAIVIFSFVVVVIGGANIGSSLITNRVRGEEPTPTIIEYKAVKPTATEYKADSTTKEN